jgi:NSS family neurotransmitter:Na+ symporter
MTTTSTSRGVWGSRLGFVLAAAGSAIGLGNIWKFPIETGQNGGAAFVFVYLICVFSIGIPVMIAELALGRKTGSNPVGAYKKLVPKSAWKMVGGLGVVTGLMILSAYAVVAGWILKYIWFAVTGAFSGKSAEAISGIFAESTANGWQSILFFVFFLALTAGVVAGGVQGGIERASRTLMPILLLLLILLCIRSVTLPGAGAGVAFYLKPDFSKLDFDVIMAALGQAFFSLSLGMGTMITYGSSTRGSRSSPAS